MTHKRILLIAPEGQVGWHLHRCAQTLGKVIIVGRSYSQGMYAQLDLAHFDAIRRILREVKPHIILNAAAYTAVDKAEQEVELAQAINGTAPGILAEEAKQLNALLVHYSTDYVFNGQHHQPYSEIDPVQPLGVYGATKLAGEQAIAAVGGQYLTLRTAWVYDLRGKNFLLTIQRLAAEREELRIVADQQGSPVWSRLIAEATVQILSQLYSPLLHRDRLDVSGIYHLTCAGQTTWYEFAKAIVAHQQKQPRILPITTTDYPTPAKRPAYSVLSNAKLQKTFGIYLPSWDGALELCLKQQGKNV